ncbi:MAG: DUF433 domain-containing protein [Desulfobacteraceae bacterium]|nr:DUF433 domain-containing protein [Desulfobacteraceae bacterium]
MDLNRIVVDPKILVGKPIIRGTRLSVDFILDLMAQGWSEAEILRNYPNSLKGKILRHVWRYACVSYPIRKSIHA